MKERVKELKAEARANKKKADGETANLDEGDMWPTAFALKKLTATEEERIVALVKQALS